MVPNSEFVLVYFNYNVCLIIEVSWKRRVIEEGQHNSTGIEDYLADKYTFSMHVVSVSP